MIERQKAVTRERGREEYKYVKYEPVVCEPYSIAAAATYERHWFSGAFLRASHPARGNSYASLNLVLVVIVAVAVVLFVACSRASAFTQQR